MRLTSLFIDLKTPIVKKIGISVIPVSMRFVVTVCHRGIFDLRIVQSCLISPKSRAGPRATQAGLRQVLMHITVSTVLTQAAIPKKGGQKTQKQPFNVFRKIPLPVLKQVVEMSCFDDEDKFIYSLFLLDRTIHLE